MRRPPLISFLTYNRLGDTVVSLASLLRCHDDFDLFLIDNGSRDATWEYLNDTKDPRIKYRHRFDIQVGCAHALNYTLTTRKEDQDWINFENDFRIHDVNFVKHFHEYYQSFPEMGAFSAIAYPNQREMVDELIKKDSSRYETRDKNEIYYDTVMGFLTYIPYETMNLIGYYDEVNCLLDIELQTRFKMLNKPTGYALNIPVSHLPAGGHCPTCLAYQRYCTGAPHCTKYYSRVISKVTERVGFQGLQDVNKLRMEGKSLIKCGSIFSGRSLSKDDRIKSQYIISLFAKFTKEFEEGVDK